MVGTGGAPRVSAGVGPRRSPWTPFPLLTQGGSEKVVWGRNLGDLTRPDARAPFDPHALLAGLSCLHVVPRHQRAAPCSLVAGPCTVLPFPGPRITGAPGASSGVSPGSLPHGPPLRGTTPWPLPVLSASALDRRRL